MTKTFEQGKEEVEKLCRYFETNQQAFLAPGVKEAHVRQSLIDPFFEALGWDVRNTAMAAPQYREVIPEDSLDIEGHQKAPDYVFRVGTLPKFYSEAKKCGVNINADPGPAYQLRRYGWSAKVSLSILTDFEELGVYDCAMMPHPGDKASHARIQYLQFKEYPDRWRELWDIFSREAVWSGAFDQYAASKRKRGTSEVDVEFLKEIEGWRDALARNIAIRNDGLSPDDLNAAVQRTIDRIVFLRMAEDRGLESYSQLLKLCEEPDIYSQFMRKLCRKADEKYNSGLFHFQKEPGVSETPDLITPKLTVDDKVMKTILQSLYFEHGSPYHFGVMPVEILGTVYERFLGKVIRLTAGHQAKVEEKPEVKKAGGVYYTPKYIVDYIVRNTLGKLICGRDTLVSGRDTLVPDKPIKTVSKKLLIRQHNLPHWQIGGSIYFVSFRSARGVLPDPAMRQVMENIKFDDGKRYDLFLAVVMPDHVHMLIKPREIKLGEWFDLGEIMKGIKGVSARKINEILGATGSVWQDENYDHIVRDEQEFDQKLQYMLLNPVKAGLVKEAEQYQFFVRDRSVPPTSVPATGLSPKQISEIKILDPACGSGSFLLGAFQYLLEYHLKWYVEHQAEIKKINEFIYQGCHGQWFLTNKEKKRILLNNIFGVDIDLQAVEVTKLSLLLKALEGEDDASLSRQLSLFHERALPNLAENIKCGNSLITPDYFTGKLIPDPEEMKRVNPFDWNQGFPEAMKDGGFDCIIGNPPYIRIQTMKDWAPLEVEIYKELFQSAKLGNYDIYVVFIEQGLKLLNAKGKLGFICPNKFFNAKYGESIRSIVAEGKHLAHVVHFGDQQVFDGATTYTCLLFLDKSPTNECRFVKVDDLMAWRTGKVGTEGLVKAKQVTASEWNFAVGNSAAIFEKLSQMPVKLFDIAHIFVGLQTDADDIFILEEIKNQEKKVLCRSKATEREHWFEKEHLKPFLKGSLNIRRYCLTNVTKKLIFPYETIDGKSVLISQRDYKLRYPLTWAYLEANRQELAKRNKGQMGQEWHGYVYRKNHTRFGNPKILVPSLATGSCFSIDFDGRYYFVGSGGGGGGGYGITLNSDVDISILYLLGLLNSKLLSAAIRANSTPFRGGYIALNRQYIERLPIRPINKNDSADKNAHDRMVKLVEAMLALHPQLSAAKSEAQKEVIQRQISATDREIDRLVYDLYGLTKEEIAIVEERS